MGSIAPAVMMPTRAYSFLGFTREPDQRWSWRTLQHKSFRYYFLGSVISDMGTWLQNTAQVLLAYHLSHSPLDVGLVTCAQFTSPLVLGPWAGVLADRFGGRRTLLLTQLVAAAIAATLAVLSFCQVLTEWSLVIGALAGGLAFTFALPARNVTVRRLVPANEARPAFVLDNVSYNFGRAVAPPVSVLLVIWTGTYGWAFAANAITFVAFTLALLLAGNGAKPEPERRSRLKDGFTIARHSHTISLLLLMVAAVTIADDPVQVLGPALASRLGVSQDWSGWFIAALGAGSVAGSLRRPKHLPRLRLAATVLAALGVCMVVFVSAPSAWVSLGAAVAAGITCLLANSMTRTLLSKKAGVNQASVMAIYAIAWAGSKPFASLTDGALASSLGVTLTGIILALPAFVPITLLAARAWLPQRWLSHVWPFTIWPTQPENAQPEPALTQPSELEITRSSIARSNVAQPFIELPASKRPGQVPAIDGVFPAYRVYRETIGASACRNDTFMIVKPAN